MAETIVAEEAWSTFWPDAEPLANAHALEVDGGVAEGRRFKLDLRIMSAMYDAGVLKIVTARRDGRMVGYFTWNVHTDVESEGLLIGMQGAWFVAPGNPRVAVRLFDASLEMLKRLGVQCVFPHHRTQGRGANIGRFFKRRGAKHTQENYTLWIGE